MRVLASLSTVAVTTVLCAACGLDVGGLGEVASTEGGPTLDGSETAEGGSSSGGSSGSSGADGATDGTMGDGGGSSSGADSTVPPQDASMTDSGSPKDSSVADTFVADTYVVETAPPCTTANGCYVIPSGWTLVAFAPSQSTACPGGFAGAQPESLVELPITGGCACAACANGTPPTCTGAVGDYFDDPNGAIGGLGGTNCGAQGTPATNKNSPAGQCGTDLYMGGTAFGQLSYKDFSLKYVPPTTLTGGTCTSGGSVSGTPTYAAQDRMCVPDNAQSGVQRRPVHAQLPLALPGVHRDGRLANVPRALHEPAQRGRGCDLHVLGLRMHGRRDLLRGHDEALHRRQLQER